MKRPGDGLQASRQRVVQEYERSILSDGAGSEPHIDCARLSRKLYTGAHGLLVFTFWVLLINLTNKLPGASRTSPKQEAEAYDAPGGPRQ